jgi:ribosome maturation factor RimP
LLNKLNDIVNQVVSGFSLELVDIEISPTRTVAIFIDKPGGVTIEDCENLSKHLSKLFLVENIEYNRLEVSSPGVERPLKKLSDYTRFLGAMVKIKTKQLIDQNKVFKGLIREVKGNNIYLELDNKNIQEISFDNILKAKLVFELAKNINSSKK